MLGSIRLPMRWVLLIPSKIADRPMNVAVRKIRNPRKLEKRNMIMERDIRMIIERIEYLIFVMFFEKNFAIVSVKREAVMPAVIIVIKIMSKYWKVKEERSFSIERAAPVRVFCML